MVDARVVTFTTALLLMISVVSAVQCTHKEIENVSAVVAKASLATKCPSLVANAATVTSRSRINAITADDLKALAPCSSESCLTALQLTVDYVPACSNGNVSVPTYFAAIRDLCKLDTGSASPELAKQILDPIVRGCPTNMLRNIECTDAQLLEIDNEESYDIRTDCPTLYNDVSELIWPRNTSQLTDEALQVLGQCKLPKCREALNQMMKKKDGPDCVYGGVHSTTWFRALHELCDAFASRSVNVSDASTILTVSECADDTEPLATTTSPIEDARIDTTQFTTQPFPTPAITSSFSASGSNTRTLVVVATVALVSIIVI